MRFHLFLFAFFVCTIARAELTVIPQTVSPSKHFAFAKLPHEKTLADRTIANAVMVRLPGKTASGRPFRTEAAEYNFLYEGTDEFLSSRWNSRESYVAVVCLNRKFGDIEVFRRTSHGVERLQMPDPEKIAMRRTPGAKEVMSIYLEARRWIHGTTLEAVIGGAIFTGDHGEAAGLADYVFVLRISFAGPGKGRVTSIRRSQVPIGI